MKIFFVKHQAAGVVHECPFAGAPNEQQLAAVAALCLQNHGFGHPKTDDVPWTSSIVEVELIGPSDVLEVKAPPKATAVSPIGEVTISGEGSVTLPG